LEDKGRSSLKVFRLEGFLYYQNLYPYDSIRKTKAFPLGVFLSNLLPEFTLLGKFEGKHNCSIWQYIFAKKRIGCIIHTVLVGFCG
jgi:hypothetical protein